MFGPGKRAKERRLQPFAIQGDALGSASRGASVITAARDCCLLAVYSIVQLIRQRSPVGGYPSGGASVAQAFRDCGRSGLWTVVS